MNKKLEVHNLRVSFKTQHGTLRAVRGIDFAIEKGETLAIVGESGSGKSVTAKAILGILSRNSIVESGEIIYEGRDLLKLSQEEFDKLRGNRISMIYQDPLSSLDPIMRVGKQMTEATVINGKINHRRGKKLFHRKLKALNAAMSAAGIAPKQAAEYTQRLSEVILDGCRRHTDYMHTREYAEAALFSCEQLEVAVRKADEALVNEELGFLRERIRMTNPTEKIRNLAEGLPGTAEELHGLLSEAVACEEPDFPEIPKVLRDCLLRALSHSEESYRTKRQEVLKLAEQYLPLFESADPDVAAWKKAVRELNRAVKASINALPVTKNSAVHTFAGTMTHSVNQYAKGIKGNEREKKRVLRDTQKYERIRRRGGDAPKVIPPMLVDLELVRENMVRALSNLISFCRGNESPSQQQFEEEVVHILDWLKEQGNAVVQKVTKQYAYDKAIRIMEEVGISEPRRRFEQYPFEFSGGMRQRIVIAIAIASNPDILICDEPTTALDVTIQSQILELINSLKRRHNLTVIFITHDLGVVANMADKVGVMYAGKLVEYGTVDDLFYEPAHPYTWALLSSMPDLDTEERLEAIPGTPPNMIYPPEGDAFAARNRYALAVDFKKEPPRFELSETHWAATWLLHPKAPKVEMPAIVSERIARMRKLEEEAQRNESE